MGALPPNGGFCFAVRRAQLMRCILVVLLTLVAAPVAHGGATLISRDVPLRQGALVRTQAPFGLVGLHWQGPGSVSFRTRRDGVWSSWRRAAPEEEDGPDRGSRERPRPGWRIGNPYWVGGADALQVRRTGSVARVRAHFVRSTVPAVPPARLAIAQAPAIVPRAGWNANESIRRAPPAYAASLEYAVIHHTAGSNNYTAAQSASIVRSIQVFHVQGNGWNDVGYNFLVDKYGQVFEGRYGGVDRNVVGAHAEAFNTGSVGVAVLGTYGSTQITPAARNAVARLLAWRLDLAHVDPVSTLTQLSGGNARFPAGVPVFLRAVSGHRDTGFTSCPGDALYSQLGTLARAAAGTGLPKLYEPVVRGAVGRSVRFTARLSAPLAWSVTVTDAAGATVATGTGTGTAVDWTWDSVAAPPGRYVWTIAAGPAVLPATGSLAGGAATTLTLTGAGATPTTLTPNGDGVTDAARVTYRISVPATVTATLTTPSGAIVAALFSEPKAAGTHSFLFNAEGVIDGTYRIVLSARTNGREVRATVPILVSRTLARAAIAPAVFSPNGDGRMDTLEIGFELSSPATVRLRVMRGKASVAPVFAGPLSQGPQRLTWDGRKRIGRLVDGAYAAELTVTDAFTTISHSLPFASDTRPPAVRLVSLRPLRLRVDEPAALTMSINGVRRALKVSRAGVVRVTVAGTPRHVTVVARDAVGNVSKQFRYP